MPTSEPIVSVLLPVYNAAPFVGAAIESVLSQTFRSFELVIVNDGSTDGTSIVLARYLADERVRIVEKGSNQGLVVSLNDGLAASRSELVARLDSDDTCEPTRLERQVAAFERNPRLVLSATAYRRVRPDGSLIRVGRPPSTHAELVAGHLSGNRLCHSSVMFRRRPAMELGGYRAEWFPVEDFDLWLRLCTLGEFGAIASEEVVYLDNPNGISATRAARQYQMHRARTDAELSRLSGIGINEQSTNRSRVRAAGRAHQAIRRDLASRGIATNGLDAAAHRSIMLMLSEQPGFRRHALIAAAAPRTLLSAVLRPQPGQRDA